MKKKLKIVAVDDCDDYLVYIKRIVEREFDEFKVDFKSFLSVGDAIEYIKNEKIDILITDINMPKIDGYDLTILTRYHSSEKCIVISYSNEIEINPDIFNYIVKKAGDSGHFKKVLGQCAASYV